MFYMIDKRVHHKWRCSLYHHILDKISNLSKISALLRIDHRTTVSMRVTQIKIVRTTYSNVLLITRYTWNFEFAYNACLNIGKSNLHWCSEQRSKCIHSSIADHRHQNNNFILTILSSVYLSHVSASTRSPFYVVSSLAYWYAVVFSSIPFFSMRDDEVTFCLSCLACRGEKRKSNQHFFVLSFSLEKKVGKLCEDYSLLFYLFSFDWIKSKAKQFCLFYSVIL